MVGGDRATVDTVRPLFDAMSKTVTYMGGAGCGQSTKMVNQVLIATTMVGVVEGLLYGYKGMSLFMGWLRDCCWCTLCLT